MTDRAMASMADGKDTLDDRLSGLQAPLLIVWGADDKAVPVSEGQQMHALDPQSGDGRAGRLRTPGAEYMLGTRGGGDGRFSEGKSGAGGAGKDAGEDAVRQTVDSSEWNRWEFRNSPSRAILED